LQGHRGRGRPKRPGKSIEGNVDSRLQLQLEEDGSGSTRSKMESSGLWSLLYWE